MVWTEKWGRSQGGLNILARRPGRKTPAKTPSGLRRPPCPGAGEGGPNRSYRQNWNKTRFSWAPSTGDRARLQTAERPRVRSIRALHPAGGQQLGTHRPPPPPLSVSRPPQAGPAPERRPPPLFPHRGLSPPHPHRKGATAAAVRAQGGSAGPGESRVPEGPRAEPPPWGRGSTRRTRCERGRGRGGRLGASRWCAGCGEAVGVLRIACEWPPLSRQVHYVRGVHAVLRGQESR